jgi:hypothetical protein
VHDIIPADIRRRRDEWLTEAINLCPEICRPEAEETFRPLVRRCNAKTKKTFWAWLRLQCARSEDTVDFLEWMRESRCPLDIVKPTGGFQYTVNGGVALIDVSTSDAPAVWQVPVSRLEWALSLYPVRLRELPPTESPATRDIRLLRRRIARDSWRLTVEQKGRLVAELNGLELARSREYPPAPRYFLAKSIDGVEHAVHRMYLDAGKSDEVGAVDGDFLNYTSARIRVTVAPVTDSGLTVAKGNRPPVTMSEEIVVPNLYVVNSVTEQGEFEKALLQHKENEWGEIDESPLKVCPNAAWVGAGRFKPLTPDEVRSLGRGNVELHSDQPEDIGQLCREQSTRAKEWDSRYWRMIPLMKKQS